MGLTVLENQMKFKLRNPISPSSVKNITLEFVKRLFWNENYIFTLERIVTLLNAVSKSKYAFVNNKIKLRPGISIALQICQFLQETFHTTKNGKTKRFYHYIPSEDIRHANSALDRIITVENKGIKSYHCCLINQKGIKFRHQLCSHEMCFADNFEVIVNRVCIVGRGRMQSLEIGVICQNMRNYLLLDQKRNGK